MKVLHLIQKQQLRGAEVFTSQLSAHMVNSGHNAVIVALFKGTAQLPFDGEIINLNGSSEKKYWDVKAWKRLAAIIKEEKPHIIQANAGDTLKYAIFSKLLFRWKQPVVFRNASTISLYIKGGFVKKLYRFLFNQTDKIISVSDASAADFAKLFPECKHKIVVVPIGVEEDKKVEQKMFQNPFAASKNNNEGPTLLHVGGFTFEKNHKGLIQIYKRVLKDLPAAHLHLVGDGPLRNEIEALVKKEGLSEKVTFHGFQKEPLHFIAFADALLLPSIIEGMPGVILEAFYCQTPVVAYDTGGIRQIVKNGETGYLIEKQNENAFTEVVIQLKANKSKTQKMIENAYILVTSAYMNSTITKRFLNIYHSINPNGKPKAL